MKNRFESLLHKVECKGKFLTFTETDCNAAAKRLGLPCIPKSYIQFCSTFGVGYWDTRLLIQVPCDDKSPFSLDSLDRLSKEILQSTYNDPKFPFPKGVPPRAFVENLFFFGGYDDVFLCWDTKSCTRKKDCEMDIYFVILRGCVECAYPICRDLYEFFDKFFIGGKISDIYEKVYGHPRKFQAKFSAEGNSRFFRSSKGRGKRS